MSHPPISSPSTNSCGIVGQLEIAESSWRMRGSGRTSTAAKGTSSVCSIATVRAEKPQAGASGVPFMKRITLCSPIASAIASRIGLDSPLAAAGCAASPCNIGIGSNWLGRGAFCLAVGVFRGLGLQGEGVDRSADLGCEDLVYQAVLLDAAAPLEGCRRDRRAEVVAAARVVVDLGPRAWNRGVDALSDVLCR